MVGFNAVKKDYRFWVCAFCIIAFIGFLIADFCKFAPPAADADSILFMCLATLLPFVVIVAVLLAIIPGAITKDWSTWVYRALSFLVVSCPCALVISIPLSFFAGIGAASRYGILVKGSNYLEKFNKANTFVFDKTGTLTKGNFAVTKISPESDKEEILRLAAIAEQDSNHPIARSIVSAYGKEAERGYALTNIAGSGIEATNGKDKIYCGNEKLMQSNGIQFEKEEGLGTVVYVARNGKFIGSLLIADEIK